MIESGNTPIIALLYDFDKTLCTKDMQEYSFIPSVGMSRDAFWGEVGKLADSQEMDRILAYMYLMLRKSRERGRAISRENLVGLGKDIEYFPGVETWFERINKIGQAQGVIIEHYIISSGLKEIIEGSSIEKHFKEIYACEFHYEENGIADWPKAVVNYTTKTQFVFRINKGMLDPSDDAGVNRYTPEEERRIPFKNMIYIGDGITDVPCMGLVKNSGGCSIAVYKCGGKPTAQSLLKDGRVNYIFPADYREGSGLEAALKDIITGMTLE